MTEKFNKFLAGARKAVAAFFATVVPVAVAAFETLAADLGGLVAGLVVAGAGGVSAAVTYYIPNKEKAE